MQPGHIRNVVILGGGTAGWMTAACLAKVFGPTHLNIRLVESQDIGTVGVGEATIPMINLFNAILGISDADLIRETEATFKLGIEFADWRKLGHSYFHPFGTYGANMEGLSFLHYWLRLSAATGAKDYGQFNMESLAARLGKCGHVSLPDAPQLKLNKAFHFDAKLYALFLRRYSGARGVERIEGTVTTVGQNAESGFVETLDLSDGRQVSGDLFIDCSGFAARLISGALGVAFDDWSHWLPCNRALAVPSERVAAPIPYTRATAREAGWQWRIPLQHRTGNGYVFCDGFISEDAARAKLLANLDGPALAELRLLKFTTGHRRRMWEKNVVAIGLTSGFLEPLESTSIFLVQSALARLVSLFPRDGIDPAVCDKFNHDMLAEYASIRDFLIAHYKLTERDDSDFWNTCRTMPIPDSLAARLGIFERHGILIEQPFDLFKETSWFAVLMGQGLNPQGYHPAADVLPETDFMERMKHLRKIINQGASSLPLHDTYLTQIKTAS